MNEQSSNIVKAVQIELASDTRTADAMQQVIIACLRHVTGNTTQLHELDAEAVHQTRVGLRRTRSALSLFRRQLDKDARKHLNSEARALGNVLGPARDWDVFLAETLPRAAKQIPAIDAVQLDVIRQRALAKRLGALEEVDVHENWEPLSDQIAAIKLRGDELDDPISEAAPDLLARQARRVRRCTRHVKTSEERHVLRKAMKKLRYGVEFLGSLYDHKAVSTYLDHCKAAQGVLGEMNDISTTIRLCGELDAGLPSVADYIIDWAERQEVKAVSALAPTLSEFRAAKPFW